MPKSERRELQRKKKRYGPTTTNPGLRIVARELARKASKASKALKGATE